MFKQWQQRKSDGFTLIELLVVIAIIGILAALLFPAIDAALTKANGLKIGNNGKQIHLGVFTENLDLDQINLPLIWPVQDAAVADGYDAAFVAACVSSTTYLQYLYDQGIPKGIDFSFFAAPNIIQAQGTNMGAFTANNNAWCVTLNITDDSPASTPFLFTKNFNFTAGTIDTLDEAGAPLTPGDQTPTGRMPFKDKIGILITKGGKIAILRKKDLIDTNDDPRRGKELFNPGGVVLPYLDPNGLGS
jgi:prepilin-type N-terminal cleavage/methylation domain-containing protein